MGKVLPTQGICVAAATLMAVIVSTGLLFAGPSLAKAQTLVETGPENSVFATKAELQNAITAVTNQISTLSTSVTSLESTVKQISTSVTAIESQLSTIDAAIKDLQTRVTALEHRLPG